MDRLGPGNFSTLQMKGHVYSPRNDADPRNDPLLWNDPQIDPEMIPTPKWLPLFFLSTPKWSPSS